MGKSTGTTIEVWKGRAHWHWHLRRNGRIVADAENFPSKGNAMRAAKAVITGLYDEWGLSAVSQCVFYELPDKGDGVTRLWASVGPAPVAAPLSLAPSKVVTLNRRMRELTGAPVPIEIKLP